MSELMVLKVTTVDYNYSNINYSPAECASCAGNCGSSGPSCAGDCGSDDYIIP